jgi:hypothetical protein
MAEEKTKVETVKVEVKGVSNLLKFLTWLTGVIVSLMMGFAMINKYIIVPHVPILAVIIAGWAVLVVTVLNIILAIFKK